MLDSHTMPGADGTRSAFLIAAPENLREPADPEARGRTAPHVRAGWRPQLHHAGVALMLLLASVLAFYGFDRVTLPNQYYAATVFSMLQNWHAFFFASFDPAGFVTVDKPPLGFWIQTASARLLGFSAQSVLLPEALSFVGAVALTYWLVRRAFGPVPGLIAGLALAVMPISVVISRNNTIDSILVFVLLLACWSVLKATESGQARWLMLSAALVGVGFEIKMLQAYLAAPAIFLTYLIAAPARRWARIAHLAGASVVLLAVSLAWPLAVDLTPASQRPYVGSTQDNSAISLAVGYNGLQRLLGRDGTLGTASDDRGGFGPNDGAAGQAAPDGGGPGGFGGPGGSGGPGGFGEDGVPGPFRLFNEQLGGQISWLLPLAVLGLALALPSLWTHRRSLSRDRRSQAAVLFGGWLVTAAAFFSAAEFWHTYYLVMLGPPVAALAAVAVWRTWQYGQERRWLVWSLPMALLGTALAQAFLLSRYPEYQDWLARLVVGLVAAATAVLLVAGLASRAAAKRGSPNGVTRVAAAVGVLALLIVPTLWSGMSVVAGATRGPLPLAGPAQARGPFGDGNGPGPQLPNGPTDGPAPGAPGGFDDGQRGGRDGAFGGPNGFGPSGGFGGVGNQSALIQFLQANRGDAGYLLATGSANQAAPIILATAQPVMALGGFAGSDPILTSSDLASRVQAGEVRYFLLGGGPGPQGRNGSAAWVQSNCVTVPAEAAGGTSSLYDCKAAAGGSA